MRIKNHPILSFPEKKEIPFYFEGKLITGKQGDMIAFALHDHGIKTLSYSSKLKRPRGFYCAIGNCASCNMRVDGVDNVRTCITPLKEGMHVDIQKNKGVIK
jgi:predicted molibdopterin-dependent oxidoreductase YjgC